MTEWRDVIGWVGYYQVSSIGEVRALERVIVRSDGSKQSWPTRMMRPMLNSKGYLAVRLSAPGRRIVVPVHRLVALAFLPNPHGYPEVNHLNGVKTQNMVSNLEWTTPYGNRKHAWDLGLRTRAHLPIKYGLEHSNAKLSPSAARDIRDAVVKGESLRGLARRYGVDRTTIRDLVRGKTWKLPSPPDQEQP